MNKIVCLLVASLVCVGVASGADSTEATKLVNDMIDVNTQLAVLGNSITEMSANSDYLTTADADTLTRAGTYLVNAVASILGGNGGDKEEIAAEFWTFLTPVESNIIAHLKSTGAKVGSTSTEIKAAVTTITNLFNAMNIQVDAILDTATQLAPTESS